MYASALRSEAAPVPPPRPAPARQRSEGRIALSAVRLGGATRALRIAESGAARVRLPRVPGSALEGVIINTAGGIACGDRFAVEASAGPGADLVLATPAAEKIYRSDGPAAEVTVRLALEDGAALAWLPQETILFDAARLRRRFDADLAENARLTAFETLVFGRAASGEEVANGLVEDRWRVRRGGRLVYAETFRLAGPIAALLDQPPIGGGARALATFLYVAPDAEARLEEARAHLAESDCACGASAWNGLLAVRFLSREAAGLRAAATRFIEAFRGAPMPRVWR